MINSSEHESHDVEAILQKSAEISKELGKLKIDNKNTIMSHFDLDGVNLWTAIETHIALYIVYQELSENVNPFLNNRLRPHISLIKKRFNIFLYKIRGVFSNTEDKKTDIISFGLSNYMYRDVLEKITNNISSKEEKNIFVLTEDFKKDKSSNIKFFSIWSFWNIRLFFLSIIHRISINKKIKIIKKGLQRSEIQKNIKNMAGTDLKYTFNWVLNFHIPLLVDKAIVANALVKKTKPAIFLSPDNANTLGRLLSLSGRNNSTKTIEVQLSNFAKAAVQIRFSLSDKFAIWGDYSMAQYIYHGVNQNKLFITGSPRHDKIDPRKITTLKKSYSFENKKKIILIASTGNHAVYNNISNHDLLIEMKKELFQGFCKIQNYQIFLKPHPLENILESKNLLKNSGITVMSKGDDIAAILSICDIFVSFGSTSSFDALVADKLCICPEFGSWGWSKWITKSGAILNPNSKKEMQDTINLINNSSLRDIKNKLSHNRANYLNKIIYKNDQASSDRIIELIDSELF